MQLPKLLGEMAWQALLGALPKDHHGEKKKKKKTQFQSLGHVLKPLHLSSLTYNTFGTRKVCSAKALPHPKTYKKSREATPQS